jgi:hypothetical protein
MDEVIADAVSEHLARYNRDFHESLTVEDLRGKWLWDVVRIDRHGALESYLRSADFFSVLDVMPHAQRVIQALQSRYEVFIASAAMEIPTSFAAKYDWLTLHFPFVARAPCPSSPPRTSSSAATRVSSAPTSSSTTTPASSAPSRAKASSSAPPPTPTSPASAASPTGST